MTSRQSGTRTSAAQQVCKNARGGDAAQKCLIVVQGQAHGMEMEMEMDDDVASPSRA